MTAVYSQAHEDKALAEVRERLRSRFEERSPAEIGQVVDKVTEEFASARIRDYVPLLVEKMSKEELNAHLATR